MTPVEIAAAARGISGAAAVKPLARGGLEKLMARFPDLEVRHDGDR